jgi:hypothetical protein
MPASKGEWAVGAGLAGFDEDEKREGGLEPFSLPK